MKRFLVFHPYFGDEGHPIEALTSRYAAERFGEYFDAQGDYAIVGGGEETVIVESPDGTREEFIVTAEAVPVYSASKVTT